MITVAPIVSLSVVRLRPPPADHNPFQALSKPSSLSQCKYSRHNNCKGSCSPVLLRAVRDCKEDRRRGQSMVNE